MVQPVGEYPVFAAANSSDRTKNSAVHETGEIDEQRIDFVGVGLADSAVLPSNFSILLFCLAQERNTVCVRQGRRSLLVSGC
jgi:hypothetical protein